MNRIFGDAKWMLADTAAKSVEFAKDIHLETRQTVKKAILKICGYGIYEAYINGTNVCDEVLLPGYHSYDLINEFQIFDVTSLLKKEENNNQFSIILGNGWYKGRFVFDGGYENLYGKNLKAIAELKITYTDDTKEIIYTNEDWSCKTYCVKENSIYDGEIQDYREKGKDVEFICEPVGTDDNLTERSNVPIKIVEKIAPIKIIHTPGGDQILDFGEMITGWVTFYCHEEAEKEICLQYGEWMQKGEFYRDNLRTAKAEFRYVSDGTEKWIRPHFTFYGFRYVKITGVKKISMEDFIAHRIRSNCKKNGKIVTGNQKINRLIANAYASQECNFLDIPTDCPQRDERMGWTGDIGIFADTACFQMECSKFLEHYMEMVGLEQKRMNGAVPFVVPFPKLVEELQKNVNPFLVIPGSCAWGDVAAIVPWTLYEHYRDKETLKKLYPVMKLWVEYEKSRVEKNEVPHLWQQDMQLGDWLALDSQDPNGLFGLTDTGFIASAYYYHSSSLTKKAAEVLGYEDDALELEKCMKSTKGAFLDYYLDKEGNLKITETQTAYLILLGFQLCPTHFEEKTIASLKRLIKENNGHLSTGFVGTPLLCQVLSEYGEHELACEILLNEEYPGWLYEVNLGAVSIWERWNSVDENGIITRTDMNSLNHYAYGSIVAWIYRYICGFIPKPDEENTLIVAPRYCEKLGFVNGEYTTPWGTYRISWQDVSEDKMECNFVIPKNGIGLFATNHGYERLKEGAYTRVVRKNI